MNKSMFVHYKNKFPGGRIDASDTHMNVFCADGLHQVSMHKNGNGDWVCRSEELGCVGKHDMGSLPKWARVWKLHKDGRIAPAEEAETRQNHVESYGKTKIPGAQGTDKEDGDFEKGEFNHKDAQKMMKYAPNSKKFSDDSEE